MFMLALLYHLTTRVQQPKPFISPAQRSYEEFWDLDRPAKVWSDEYKA